MQDQRRQTDRGEEEKEQHSDISLRELDEKRCEFLPEREQARALDQIAMARIESTA